MSQPLYKIEAIWDREAQVWVAQSNDVPGLATEANDLESLTDKLKIIIPELLQLNDLIYTKHVSNIAFELISYRQESIQVAG
jgi:hypothetical protein